MAAPAPMSGHFFWADTTETHIANLFTDWAQIPTGKAILIIVLRYLDPVTLQEYTNPKIGHCLGGKDFYYVNATGAGPNNIEYALYNSTENRTTVYQLLGQNIETRATNVRVNTFPSNRIYQGGLVTDQQWDAAVARSLLF